VACEGCKTDIDGISVAGKERDQGLAFLGTVEVVTMKELIKYMAQALVDNPDMVEVSEVVGEQNGQGDEDHPECGIHEDSQAVCS
jgi:hypothetical protein